MDTDVEDPALRKVAPAGVRRDLRRSLIARNLTRYSGWQREHDKGKRS